MNRLTIIAAFFALLYLAGHSALAQSGYDLFQKGLVQERTEGDLDEAIRLYKQIVTDHKDDRALVAKALVQMGQCYEKLGRAEARKAYERVVREFADQAEPVLVARRHLEQLDAGTMGTAGNGATYRLVFDDGIASMPAGGCQFSPGGDRIVFASEDKLCIADQTGTVIRTILDGSGPWEFLSSTRWSPDGRLISYRATRASDSGTGRMQAIFIISPEGGTPRQIGPQVRGTVHGPYWTPDGKHLTYTTWGEGGGLHTFTLDGDKVRFIRVEDMVSEGTRLHWGYSYSPDGRWLVYSRKKENAKHRLDMDLYIIPATGGTPRRLTHLPEFNGHTAWAPDSRTVYFVSGPPHRLPGTRNIWKLAMDPETGSAKGEPQQVTFFKDVYIMWPQVLGDGDRIGFTMWRQNTTSIQVADASAPQEARSLVRSGKYAPELSPDGKTVYYINDRLGKEGIYAVSREGGTARRLTETLPAKGYPHAPLDLSPNGKMLAFFAELDREYGLYILSVNGGKPRLLVKITNEEFNETVPQWSPDGSSLAYATTWALCVIGGDGGKPRKLATLKGYWEGSSVRWSPDGKYIASFGSSDPNSNNAVLVVPASGGEPRQLTPVTTWLQRLEWHPDGKRLTYHVSQYDSETRQAYLDGRPPSLLVDAPGVWDYEGAWAPDGRQFFFLADGGLHVYDEASDKTTFVADCGDTDEESVPCWSRDGKTMAWTATRTTARQTWIMEDFLPKSKTSE